MTALRRAHERYLGFEFHAVDLRGNANVEAGFGLGRHHVHGEVLAVGGHARLRAARQMCACARGSRQTNTHLQERAVDGSDVAESNSARGALRELPMAERKGKRRRSSGARQAIHFLLLAKLQQLREHLILQEGRIKIRAVYEATTETHASLATAVFSMN